MYVLISTVDKTQMVSLWREESRRRFLSTLRCNTNKTLRTFQHVIR